MLESFICNFGFFDVRRNIVEEVGGELEVVTRKGRKPPVEFAVRSLVILFLV